MRKMFFAIPSLPRGYPAANALPLIVTRDRVFALVVVATFFEPTPREGKPLFAHERAVA